MRLRRQTLTVVAELAQIFGLVIVLAGDDVAGWVAPTALTVGVIALAAVAVADLRERRRLVIVSRADLTEEGRQLITRATRDVVLVGSDLSWAHDYAEAVRVAVQQRGKTVVVFYMPGNDRVSQNVSVLQDAGAELVPCQSDTGLRIILTDRDEPTSTRLMLARRVPRPAGGPRPSEGERGSDATDSYSARVYDLAADELLVSTVTRVVRSLLERRA